MAKGNGFEFTSNGGYRYSEGALFLGRDPKQGFDVGIQTERHAITIAGAGAGKGAALMIPNLQRWPHNALVIDPKGEAAEATAEAREAMGQAVHVLDPFGVATVPDRFRAKFNPLRAIDRAALDARESIGVIADGLVMRHDPRASHWDGGGLSVLAGLIAYVCDQADDARRTLPEIRSILTAPLPEFNKVVGEMATNGAFGNLPSAASARLTRSGSEAGHFLQVAEENTKWLDSPAIAAVMSDSTFDLSDLKTKPCTVYLVLPAHLLGEHGRFLRLFVRMALNAMAKGGAKGGRRCLFMLDEFYALGHIDEVAKASGLMRGYGVSLWPIMQSLGQLNALYGEAMAGDFFANADAHVFFGNTDAPTLGYISQRIGVLEIDEIPDAPIQVRGRPMTGQTAASLIGSTKGPYAQQTGAVIGGAIGLFGALADGLEQAAQSAELNEYQRHLNRVGKPRVAPDAVRELIGKKDGDAVARSMIVFAKGGDVLNVKLAPYFEKQLPQVQPPALLSWGEAWVAARWKMLGGLVVWLALVTLSWVALLPNETIPLTIQTLSGFAYIAWVWKQVADARRKKA